MGGGLMQLVAYGAQDVYITGNPQITFFKVVYRRHTNFSMECIEQTLNGTVGYGNRLTATISRNGDLVHKMHFEVTGGQCGSAISTAQNYGHGLFKEIEVQIGGQRIDKQYSQWLQIWSELSREDARFSADTRTQYQKMSGVASSNETASAEDASHADRIFVPLQFWFNRNPGLALPLIALQYHEVKLVVDLAASGDFATAPSATSLNVKLWVDYIYLDTDERRRFAQTSHEYLIEQIQFTGVETLSSGTGSVRLNFNHPVKELVWVVDTTSTAADLRFDQVESSSVAKLQLNGHDRFAEQNAKYFTRLQCNNHHTNIPGGNNISVYSFALKPEEHQPSGTCNFSRIDNATLKLTSYPTGNTDNLRVFAVNYNVLRVMSGMGALAYSN